MTEQNVREITNLLAATLLADPDRSLVSTPSNPWVIHSRLAKLTQQISGAEGAEQEVKLTGLANVKLPVGEVKPPPSSSPGRVSLRDTDDPS